MKQRQKNQMGMEQYASISQKCNEQRKRTRKPKHRITNYLNQTKNSAFALSLAFPLRLWFVSVLGG